MGRVRPAKEVLKSEILGACLKASDEGKVDSFDQNDLLRFYNPFSMAAD